MAEKKDRERLEAEWAKALVKESAIDDVKNVWDQINPKPTVAFKRIDDALAVELGLKFSF